MGTGTPVYGMLGLLMLSALVDRTMAATGYFWHINDIHYDPTYETTQESCLIEKANGPFGDYKCDSPWSLVASSVTEMKSLGPDPAFIMWNGDAACHAHKEDSVFTEDLVLTLIHNLTSLIQTEFPGIPVFPSLGNLDYYPKDALPVGTNRIYQEVGKMWSVWLTPAAVTSFSQAGYYTAELDSVAKVRVVVINSNIWYWQNPLAQDTEDPGGHLAWTRAQLDQARTDGYKVYFVSHMQPGPQLNADWTSTGAVTPDDARNAFSDRYNKDVIDIMKSYSDVIIMAFAGHNHGDAFSLYYGDDGEPVSAFLVIPAVAPMYGAPIRNPGFRKFIFDTNSYALQDYHQYYFDLPASNAGGVPQWEVLYSFSDYGYDAVNPGNLHALLQKLTADDTEFQTFARNARQGADDVACVDTCKAQYLCTLRHVDYQDWADCMNAELSSAVKLRAHVLPVTMYLILAYFVKKL